MQGLASRPATNTITSTQPTPVQIVRFCCCGVTGWPVCCTSKVQTTGSEQPTFRLRGTSRVRILVSMLRNSCLYGKPPPKPSSSVRPKWSRLSPPSGVVRQLRECRVLSVHQGMAATESLLPRSTLGKASPNNSSRAVACSWSPVGYLQEAN